MNTGRISSLALVAGFGLALAGAIGLALVLRFREAAENPPAVPGPSSTAPVSVASSGEPGFPDLSHTQDPRETAPKPPKAKPPKDDGDAGETRHPHVVPTPESLEKTIHGKGSAKDKAAALKLAYRSRVDPKLKAFSEILTEAGMEADLRVAAIRILSDGSAGDAAARGLLESFASGHPSTDPGRDLALASVLRSGTDAELSRCSDIVFREHNAESVASAAHALAGNPSEAARSLLLSISNSHPDPDARHRAEEERTGKYCPDHVPPPESKDE